MKNRFSGYLFVPALILVAGLSAPLRADVIVNAGVTPDFPSGGPEMGAAKIADSFTIFSQATISEITFWTVQASDQSFLGSFAWAIYADAAGALGALEGSGDSSTDSLTRTKLADSIDYGMGFYNEYQNVIDLTSPLSLDPGGSPAKYWLVLHNEDPTDPTGYQYKGLYWILANQNAGDSMADPAGSGFISTNFNQAFQLSGTGNENPNNPSAVPEPASLGLLGTALAGVGVVLRRRAVSPATAR